MSLGPYQVSRTGSITRTHATADNRLTDPVLSTPPTLKSVFTPPYRGVFFARR